MKKRITAILLALVLIFSLAACSSGSSDPSETDTSATSNPPSTTESADTSATPTAEETKDLPAVTLTCANYLPAGNSFEEFILNPLVAELDAAGSGITIEYFPGGTLLAGTAILDGLLDGVADMGLIACSYYPGRFPISTMFDYPINYSSATSASYTIRDFLDEVQPAEYDGFKAAIPYGTGPGAIISNKEIRNVEDFNGLQIRANSIGSVQMTALGAVPSSLAMSECYEGLRNGVVDAFLGIQEAGYAFKLQEVVDYEIYYPFANNYMFLGISDQAYEKLTADQQAIFDVACAAVFEKSAASYCGVAGYRTAEALLALGGSEYSLDEAVINEIWELVAPLTADYAAQLDADGEDGTAAMDKLLELSEKYNELYPTDK